MKLFGFKKKSDVIDLSERYKRQQEKLAQKFESQQTDYPASQNAFSFLGNLAKSNSEVQTQNDVDVSENLGEKRRKLAKRLLDMTTKIEDLSNQIYHLQQRIEVLEKKTGAGNY